MFAPKIWERPQCLVCFSQVFQAMYCTKIEKTLFGEYQTFLNIRLCTLHVHMSWLPFYLYSQLLLHFQSTSQDM